MKEFRFYMTINNQKREFVFQATSWTQARAMMSAEYRKLSPDTAKATA